MINYNQYMVFPYKEDIMFGNRAQMQSMMKKARKMQERNEKTARMKSKRKSVVIYLEYYY